MTSTAQTPAGAPAGLQRVSPRRAKVGLVSGGLGAYWPQFPDLLPQLRRSAARVSERMSALDCDVVDVGFNYRLDEPRAALGLSRIARLDQSIEKRRASVRAYRERLADIPGLELPFDEQAVERSSHFAFPVLLADRAARDRFRAELKDNGVQTTWYPALHSFTEYEQFSPAGGLPQAQATADRHCALPLSSSMTEDEIDIVVEVVAAALA